MTRINTNVSSLNAQKTLARSNNALQESLTRLSTGLRINKGKDDPAGLIASEVLRADITSVERAITNSNRANQMIATADSALGQVSSLLNDIRGLVSEAANTGAMSDEQIAANQLQIDSSLEAIDRISQVTQFQGRRLLDGNLDFLTENINTSQITDLNIEQANFGSQSQIDVSVSVTTQATQASLNYGFGAVASDVVLEVGGKDGFEAFSFASGSTIEEMAAAINLVSDSLGLTAEVERAASTGALTASSFGANNDIALVADTAGEAGGDIRIKHTAGTAGVTAGYEDTTGEAASTTAAGWTAASGTDPAKIDVTLATQNWAKASLTINEGTSSNNAFAIESRVEGTEFNDVSVVFTSGVAAASAAYDHTTKTLTIDILAADTSTAAQVVAAINLTSNPEVSALFHAELLPDNDGSGVLTDTDAVLVDAGGALKLSGGVDGGTITATANDVVTKLNTTTGVKDAVTASLPTGDDGYGTVTAFQEYAYYGTAEANNRLQLLAPEDTRDVRFVAGTSAQSLSVDLSTDPQVTAYSKAVVQMTAANASFEIEARNKGSEYDDVTITFSNNAGAANLNYVKWDPEDKQLTIFVREATDTAQAVANLINTADSHVAKFWRARAFGTSDLTGVVAVADDGNIATTSGGISSEGTVIVNLETDADGLVTTTAQDLIDYFDDTANAATLSPLGISVSNAEGSDGSGLIGATTSDLTFATSGTDMTDAQAVGDSYAVNGENARLEITAVNPGADYDNVVIEFEDTATAAAETFSYDSIQKKLTIGIESGVSTPDNVIAAWSNIALPGYDADLEALFTMDEGGTGLGTAAMTTSDTLTLTGGVTDAGTEDGGALLGNADSAAIGLNFKAAEYGSNAFVSVKALNGTSFAVTNSAGTTTERSTGTDIDARINGVQAIGDGLSASLNTSALDLNFSVASTVTSGSTMSFSITGGGAQFQLGPDVVSNQQARLGISSVNTVKMGGTAGRLFELRSGNDKSLANDVSGAASVAEEVIAQIVNLRGRLGAFQRTTLDTNIDALGDTLEALTDAESDIRDADFAAESANLTRAQVLVQSGLSVLSIANSNPQSVLSLLR